MTMQKNRVLAALALALLTAPLTPAYALTQVNFADLVAQLSPSVVNIATKSVVRTSVVDDVFAGQGTLPPELRDALKQFSRTQQVSSLGSGFIIDPTGLILTNYHVVKDAEEITVILSDSKQLKAKVLGKDSKTDLALLKVTTDKSLPAVRFADSDKIRVGEPVLAIGNPFGLGGSVTSGIVSARNRSLNNTGLFEDFIQTDASINRGNSGGPLFNAAGEVIGVNSAILSPSGGSVGIGFAIPANTARSIAQQLEKSGTVQRGLIGVRIQQITPDIAETLGLPQQGGALVAAIDKGSPAEKSGLRKGDAIIAYNDTPFTDARVLQRFIAASPVGSSVRLKTMRQGQEINRTLTLGQLSSDDVALDTSSKTLNAEITPLGVQARALNSVLREQYQIPSDVTGVLITAVQPQSAAAGIGLAVGDVLAEVQQNPVESVDDVRHLLARGKNKRVLLTIYRDEALLYVPVIPR